MRATNAVRKDEVVTTVIPAQPATIYQFPRRNPHLRTSISMWLNHVDQEQDKKLQWEILEWLRNLSRELRESGGNGIWPVIVAAACVCGLVYSLHPWAKSRVPCAIHGCTPQTSFRVIEAYNKRDFLLQRVVDGIPEPPEMRRFDEDAPFEAGHTINWLKFEDQGSVWSVRGIDTFYRLERIKGLATVPPNCHHTNPQDSRLDHIACKGAPQW